MEERLSLFQFTRFVSARSQFMMKFIVVFCLLLGSPFNNSAAEAPFSFQLAGSFDPKKHTLSDYYLSEKLDGVRAYWNGTHLRSRGGHVFSAPQWFIKALPPTPLDGELWGGRQTFDEISGIVRRNEPNDGWRKITFMVFELPMANGNFSARYKKMQQLHKQHGNQHWQIIEQRQTPKTLADLKAMLIKLDTLGGEGYMLKSKTAAYRAGRTGDLLKIKLKNDGQARVIAHYPGKGRLANVMGSIKVQMPNGIQFKIGSGFNDQQRKNPPAIGTTISYQHNGLTKNAKPSYPVFWRVFSDEGP